MNYTRHTIVIGLIVIAFTSAAAARDHQTDPKLKDVKSIFVSGNNQAAEKAREELEKGKSCFTLAGKADDADAVLDIATESQSTGDKGGFGAFGQRAWIASGNLTLKSGDLVWSHSERFDDAPFRSGGKVAGSLLIKELARDAGCKK